MIQVSCGDDEGSCKDRVSIEHDDSESYSDEDESDDSYSVDSSSSSSSDYTNATSQSGTKKWQDSNLLHVGSSMRRRVLHDKSHSDTDINPGSRDKIIISNQSKRRKPSWRRSILECLDVYHERCPGLFSQWSTVVLVLAFVFWLYIQILYSDAKNGMSASRDPFDKRPKRIYLSKSELLNRKLVRKKEAIQALGSGASENWYRKAIGMTGGTDGIFESSKARKKRKKGSTVETLPSGCERVAWQTKSFPNCNEIHETDLLSALQMKTPGPTLPLLFSVNQKNEKRSTWIKTSEMGYVDSGLWRSVWKVDPRGEINFRSDTDFSPMVLKIMKGQHEYDFRNYDRHRRDALVMERLTSSPNIVEMYGFCGNTVLTEYVSANLDDIIYNDKEYDRKGSQSNNDTRQKITRKTPLGRLRLAVGVARGISALHDFSGGPMIHADIQAKQFLVDLKSGEVKLNDFNRCRFMPRSNATGRPCPIRIPSAPGVARSPEEYNEKELTEKLDVYSTANVLYGILTGEKPWESYPGSMIKKKVSSGKIPPFDKKYREKGTSDAQLLELTEKAFEPDPSKRINATQLLEELSYLLAIEEEKNR